MPVSSIPPKTDQIWRDIATGKVSKPWQMLALKIMLTRIANVTKTDSSPATLDKAAEEIHDFFEKNMALAQADLTALFS